MTCRMQVIFVRSSVYPSVHLSFLTPVILDGLEGLGRRAWAGGPGRRAWAGGPGPEGLGRRAWAGGPGPEIGGLGQEA